MGNFIRNRLAHGVTVVSNEFIDNYMARANGEYVKVYLYLLRHQQEEVSIGQIADALNHTEADVQRALAAAGYTVCNRLAKGEWVCLAAKLTA